MCKSSLFDGRQQPGRGSPNNGCFRRGARGGRPSNNDFCIVTVRYLHHNLHTLPAISEENKRHNLIF